MRIEDHVEAKRLWCLRDPQLGAIWRRDDGAGRIDLFDGVGHGNRGHRRAGFICGLDRACNQRRRHEWPGGIVNQHNVRRVRGEGLEAGVNGSLARGATICWGPIAKPGDGAD